MPTQTEGRHAGEFILSEANGNRSRENIVISSGQNELPAGTVLEASGGEYIAYAGSTSSEAAGVLLAAVDATSADVAAVMIARDAEVNDAMLSIPVDNTAGDALAAAKSGLATRGVIAR